MTTETKHTPGPWHWFRKDSKPYLATEDRGHLYVMGFARKGMQGATPIFSHWNGIGAGEMRGKSGGVMEDGVLLKDGSLHPDARLMQASPDLFDALTWAASALQSCARDGCIDERDVIQMVDGSSKTIGEILDLANAAIGRAITGSAA